MEPPAVAAAPPPPTTTTTTTTSPKLRLMCSYGGHLVSNPRTKSLCYTGGDIGIVSITPSSAAASSLSSLTAHLSTTLSLPTPLSLKYQLPHHDLLSLIPLSTDHDLLVLLHELRRLSPTPSRIRLYLFPANNSNTRASSSLIRHPKTESWFVDALESAKIMQKGRNGNGFTGFEGEAAQSEYLSEFLSCGVNGSVAESMVLETSSSFGSSSSSSASLSNLPSFRVRDEDAGAALQDNKLKVASGESIAREQSVGLGNGNGISQWKTGVYDSEHSVASMENRISSNYVESDIKVSDPFSGIQVHKTVQAPVYHPMTPQLDQLQQQTVQFVQVGNHYIPQNPVGLLPVSSYYPMYDPQLHQQQLPHFHYQSNQPYPIYILPVAPAQPYNLPMHGGLIETETIAPSRPPMHPNSSCIPPQVTHKEPLKSGVLPDFASRVYRSTHSAMPHEGVPLNHAPHDENQQQPLGVSEMQHEPQTIAIASTESPNYSNEPDDDPARDQIYKSQPLPPSVTSTYQSMSKDTTVHLSEALAQLHMDDLKQQIATLDPQ